jgi:imidazolonepropionase
MTTWDGLLLDCHLATMAEGTDYGIVEDAALAWKDGRIAWLGARKDLPGAPAVLAREVRECGGDWLTPALVDCHTHLVFGGNRAVEGRAPAARRQLRTDCARGRRHRFHRARHARARRCRLAGGIAAARDRAGRRRRRHVEIKSGYGLDFESEARMLRVAAISASTGLGVRTTFLGAHALPPEYAGRADAYVDAACGWLRELHAQGLVDAVDAFCEGIGFTPAQTRRMFETARELGLPVKLHADQLSDLGGAALVAEFGGLSADHIEYSSEDAVRAMARAGTVAVLLPGRLPFPARNEAAAAGGAARAWRGDGGVDRPQSGHLAAVVVAPGDVAGVHALPPDAGRSATRAPPCTRRARWDSTIADGSRSACARTSRAGACAIRPNLRTGSTASCWRTAAGRQNDEGPARRGFGSRAAADAAYLAGVFFAGAALAGAFLAAAGAFAFTGAALAVAFFGAAERAFAVAGDVALALGGLAVALAHCRSFDYRKGA